MRAFLVFVSSSWFDKTHSVLDAAASLRRPAGVIAALRPKSSIQHDSPPPSGQQLSSRIPTDNFHFLTRLKLSVERQLCGIFDFRYGNVGVGFTYHRQAQQAFAHEYLVVANVFGHHF